ncbi:hypothetical protein [Clostridium sp.]|jgi:hypothetical protein|uniref:hypothetical protein n=1 Tax=Clostridium sp. TaxID=1506 RepID=UPI002FDCADCA
MNVGEKYIDSKEIYLKLRRILKKCREENRRTFRDLSSVSGFKEDELKNIEEGVDKDIVHFLSYAKILGISINLSYNENYRLF